MSNTTLDRILKQCHSFVANPDSNYMDDIFAQKLKAFSNPAFSSEDQKKLCTYHHKLILTEVIPAYQELADSLESLRGTGKSSRGLAFFEGGREYYLYLLQSQTGTYVPVGQIEKRLSAQLLSDYREISSLLEQNSSLIDRLNQCSGELTLTPTQMLEKLPELMKKVRGGCLIIEKAGEITRETAVKMSLQMSQDTAGMLVILEDTKEGIRKALGRDEEFARKFTEKVNIPIFSLSLIHI